MLMARSPKLERHRRYPSTGNNAMVQGAAKGLHGGRPRSGSAGSRTRKPHHENHLFGTPIMPGQQMFRPPDHYGNLGGPHPMMTMSIPMSGSLPPEFLKHSTGDQVPQVAGGDHTHIYPVHVPPPVPSNSTTPSQSSQHSPVKTAGGEDSKQGGSGFVPFDGNVEPIDVSSLPQPPYAGGEAGLLPVQLSADSPIYDPSSYQLQQALLLQNQQNPRPQVSGGNEMNTTSSSSSSSSQHEQSRYRRNDVCRNYLNGHCLYGEKCWFLHSDQKPHREPLLGPGGIMNTTLNMAAAGPQPGIYPGMGVDQYMAAQYVSPKSPLGAQVNPTGTNPPPWQVPGGITTRPTMFPFLQRGFVGGAQPQVLLRPFVYQNRFVTPQNDQLLAAIPDPVLRFRLLSEGIVKDSTDSLVSDISSLCVRADHFFVTFRKSLCDYRVQFGSDKPHDNHHLTNEQVFGSDISCTHVSKVTPSLLVVGTDEGRVYTFDAKRNGPANPVTLVHEPQVRINNKMLA